MTMEALLNQFQEELDLENKLADQIELRRSPLNDITIYPNRNNARSIPNSYYQHQFGYMSDRVEVYNAINQCTSGVWAYCGTQDIIAFEDEGDLTMFLLGFKSPAFKRARLV